MANKDHKYFYEDEVWRTQKGTLKFGMVVETSEFSSGDESSDDEDQVKPGTVRVAWYPSGKEEVLSEKKLNLSDRSLMPGDIVRKMSEKSETQRGFCRNVHVFSTVEIVGTKQVVYGVKSEDLHPVEMFKADVLVCKGGWVGVIREIKTLMKLRLQDGSKVVVDDNIAGELEDVLNRKEHDTEFIRYDYYPGQILFGPISVVDSGEWEGCSEDLVNMRKNKTHKAVKMTVEKVYVERIMVNWICLANLGESSDGLLKQPANYVTGDDLKEVRSLNIFDSCTLQIGDRNFYTMNDSDLVMTKSDWRKLQMELLDKKSVPHHTEEKRPKKSDEKVVVDQDEKALNSSEYEDFEESYSDADSEKHSKEDSTNPKKKNQPSFNTKHFRKKKLKMKRAQRDSNCPILVAQTGMRVVTETITTKSEVDVVWQDGTVDLNIPSSELFPIQHLDEHEFFPGDFVIESKEEFQPHTDGVIQDVDYIGRCCRVKWFKTYTDGSHPEPVYMESSENSVYDLKDHPDFKFRPGAIVIRVANRDGGECGLGAGQVLDTDPSGRVKIWWASKNEAEKFSSSCWPQDIYKVGEYDSDEGELWDNDEDEDGDDSDDSWSTESEHEVNEDEGEIHNEAKELETKIVLNLENARVSLMKVDQILSGNANKESLSTIKKVVAVVTLCKGLDRLMETDFFKEADFQALAEKLKDKEKISTFELNIQSHVSRFFSASEEKSSVEEVKEEQVFDQKTGETEKVPSSECPGKDASDEELICERLCKMIKVQLVKAHQEIVIRYGEQKALDFQREGDLDAGELNETIENELTSLGFVPLDTPIFQDNLFYPTSPAEKLETSLLEESVPLAVGSFQTEEAVPDNHKFKLTLLQPGNTKAFMKSVRREICLLRTSLPPGITVKGYEERMDLFSAMIEGPKNTPYEDGLFFFDFQLGPLYPAVPPTLHYVSYCCDKLNPNLYEDGKVCLSLLGTWNGKGTETWTPNSNLLQLLVSIQGLILVREPYFNEAGYERQKGTAEGAENSRNYNEMALLKLVQSMTRLIQDPQEPFAKEIKTYCEAHAPGMIERLENWIHVSRLPAGSDASALPEKTILPDFPLLPASKGFCISVQRALEIYKSKLSVL